MGFSRSNFNDIVEQSFLKGVTKKLGNSATNGSILLLFGNRIAEWREDGLYITNCGYKTQTTKNHLNTLPNVSISQHKHEWYLNGEKWDGKWVRVLEQTPPKTSGKGDVFDTTTHYIRTDGWRGYSEPIYGICGANDTGMYEDSPCRTDKCLFELEGAAKCLGTIPYKMIAEQTSNVFCIHRYLIVPPQHIKEARELFAAYFEEAKDKTSLLYPVNGKQEENKPESSLKSTAMVASLGNLLCDNQKDKNDWKKRMLAAGINGLSIPEDWDTLSEEEKERRLDGVIKIMTDGK